MLLFSYISSQLGRSTLAPPTRLVTLKNQGWVQRINHMTRGEKKVQRTTDLLEVYVKDEDRSKKKMGSFVSLG